MTDEIIKWPIETDPPPLPDPPRPILRPCDYGLRLAVADLETQCGSIEAYVRLCSAAAALKEKIDAGQARPQNPCYATETGAAWTFGTNRGKP